MHVFLSEQQLQRPLSPLIRDAFVPVRVSSPFGWDDVWLGRHHQRPVSVCRGCPPHPILLPYSPPSGRVLRSASTYPLTTVAPPCWPPFCVLLSGEDVDLDEQLADYGIAACLTGVPGPFPSTFTPRVVAHGR